MSASSHDPKPGMTTRLNEFREVWVDFDGVEEMGP